MRVLLHLCKERQFNLEQQQKNTLSIAYATIVSWRIVLAQLLFNSKSDLNSSKTNIRSYYYQKIIVLLYKGQSINQIKKQNQQKEL